MCGLFSYIDSPRNGLPPPPPPQGYSQRYQHQQQHQDHTPRGKGPGPVPSPRAAVPQDHRKPVRGKTRGGGQGGVRHVVDDCTGGGGHGGVRHIVDDCTKGRGQGGMTENDGSSADYAYNSPIVFAGPPPPPQPAAAAAGHQPATSRTPRSIQPQPSPQMTDDMLGTIYQTRP